MCGMAIAGALVFLDPILVWAAWPNNYWILAFSPVSWTSVEQLNILAANHFISIPFVIAADALLVIFLFILIFQTAKTNFAKWFFDRGGVDDDMLEN